MAIGNKQIGWSEKANLLWEISNQLDKLLCVNTVCQTSTSSTTTTTTTINCHCYTIVNNSESGLTYSYVDCSGNNTGELSLNVGEYVNACAIFGSILFIDGESLIIDNGVCLEVCNYSCSLYKLVAPEFPIDTTWNYSYLSCGGRFGLNSMENNDEFTDCMVVGSLTYSPEGLIVTDLGDCVVESTSRFVACGSVDACGTACVEPFNYYTVWMTQDCIDNWPSIGCEVWLDEFKTTPFPDGGYSRGNGIGCIVITGGIITNII